MAVLEPKQAKMVFSPPAPNSAHRARLKADSEHHAPLRALRQLDAHILAALWPHKAAA
jgi:hypothetical protein